MDAGSALHGPPLVRPGPGHWAGCITGAGHGVALVAVHWSVSRSHATSPPSPPRHLLIMLTFRTATTATCCRTPSHITLATQSSANQQCASLGNTMTALCNAARNTRIHSNTWTYYLTTTKINSMMPWNMCPIPDSMPHLDENERFYNDKPRQGK